MTRNLFRNNSSRFVNTGINGGNVQPHARGLSVQLSWTTQVNWRVENPPAQAVNTCIQLEPRPKVIFFLRMKEGPWNLFDSLQSKKKNNNFEEIRLETPSFRGSQTWGLLLHKRPVRLFCFFWWTENTNKFEEILRVSFSSTGLPQNSMGTKAHGPRILIKAGPGHSVSPQSCWAPRASATSCIQTTVSWLQS